MITKFVKTQDGIRLAYDVTGSGPALVLLHGAGEGHTRQSWHEAGYVDRLKDSYTVITIDARGHGESDRPERADAYTIGKMCSDILTVATDAGFEEFSLWGFSFGGNIGRYLASQSKRVSKFVMVGIPFGLAASGDFLEFIHTFRAKWDPILQAQRDGTLDLDQLEIEDREDLEEVEMGVFVAWLTAMLDWGNNEPADLLCPTLWLSGTENKSTIDSMAHYDAQLSGTQVQVAKVDGLNHQQEFFEIDTVFPILSAFLNLE